MGSVKCAEGADHNIQVRPRSAKAGYNGGAMQKRIFWMLFLVLGLMADFTMPLTWGLLATFPILIFSWWVAYRSGWFE